MITKHKYSSIILVLLLFFSMIGPRISLGNTLLDVRITTIFVLSSLYLLNVLIKKRFTINSGPIFLLILIACYYYFIVVSLNSFKDIMALKIIALTVMNIMAAKYLYSKYLDLYANKAKENFLGHLVYIFLIDAVFVISTYFNKTLWNFAYNYMGGKQMEVYEHITTIEESRRSFDIGIGSGASASINFCIFFIICMLLANKSRGSKVIITGILVLLSTALLGRTGFYLELIFIVFYIFKTISSKLVGKRRNSSKRGIKLRNIIIALILLGVTVPFLATSSQFQKFQDTTLPWIFEAFYNYNSSGVLSTATTDAVFQDMYFIPESSLQLLLGNSNLGRSDYFERITSDVGYIRSLFAFGIVGSLISYAPLLYLFLYCLRNKGEIIKEMILYSSVIILIVNLKELHLFSESYALVLFMLVLFMQKKAINSEDVDRSYVQNGNIKKIEFS